MSAKRGVTSDAPFSDEDTVLGLEKVHIDGPRVGNQVELITVTAKDA